MVSVTTFSTLPRLTLFSTPTVWTGGHIVFSLWFSRVFLGACSLPSRTFTPAKKKPQPTLHHRQSSHTLRQSSVLCKSLDCCRHLGPDCLCAHHIAIYVDAITHITQHTHLLLILQHVKQPCSSSCTRTWLELFEISSHIHIHTHTHSLSAPLRVIPPFWDLLLAVSSKLSPQRLCFLAERTDTRVCPFVRELRPWLAEPPPQPLPPLEQPSAGDAAAAERRRGKRNAPHISSSTPLVLTSQTRSPTVTSALLILHPNQHRFPRVPLTKSHHQQVFIFCSFLLVLVYRTVQYLRTVPYPSLSFFFCIRSLFLLCNIKQTYPLFSYTLPTVTSTDRRSERRVETRGPCYRHT